MKPDGTANGFLESFRHALEGVAATARGRNFRVQLAAGTAAVALGAFFRISPGEWIAVALCIGLVLGGECANTALEAAVDGAKKAGYVKKGDNVVLTAGVPLGIAGNTNMTRVVEVW